MRWIRWAEMAVVMECLGCATGGAAIAAPKPPTPAPTEVVIYNFAFHPKVLTVSVGATVDWVNHDLAAHTATRSVDPERFDSGNLAYGQRFEHTFTRAGTYAYICFYHPGMRGQIVVR